MELSELKNFDYFIAAIIIFMQRFRWGLIKTLEFLNARKPGLEMTASLLKKLL